MSTIASTTTRLVRLVALIASLLVLAVIVAGCSSSSEDAAPAAGAPIEEADGGGDEGTDSAFDSDGSPTANRSMIVTGSLYMTVDNPLAAADEAATIVKASGGRIDARGETAADEWNGASAELTLRIPTSQLDAVVEDLRGLGTVDAYSTTASDVTNQVTDLEARISTLRASTERIEGLLADAKDISDIIKLEDELASRQAELESLEAEQRGLTDQVSLSTIELSLTTVPVVIEEASSTTFVDGLTTGWNSLTAFVSGALVVLGVLLPWLALFAVGGLVVVAVVRARRNRATKSAVEPADEEPAVDETPVP